MIRRKFFSFLLAGLFILSMVQPIQARSLPALSGKLVFHRYTNYDAEDSQLYLYDFSAGTLTNLSQKFQHVHHAMNGMFSPDGKKITFMGISHKDQWDIFLYNLETGKLKNLTASDEGRHEDPKFSPKGRYICFKSCPEGKDYAQLYTYNLSTGKTRCLTSGNVEHSMPYYSKDGKTLYYIQGDGRHSEIWKYRKGKYTRIYKRTNVECYYPIVSGRTGDIYFSRWYSADNHADQIYRISSSTGKVKRMPYNNEDFDTSDYCEVSKSYGIVSTTREDDSYDLFLVSSTGKTILNLNRYCSGLNTSLQELGADYYNGK